MARIPRCSVASLFQVLWKQALLHRSEKVPEGDMDSEHQVLRDGERHRAMNLPLLDQDSPGFKQGLISSWKNLGVLVVKLSVAGRTCSALREGMQETIDYYGARIGPDETSGLRHGGGIIWQKTPCDLRALPQWREVWTTIALLEGRVFPESPLPVVAAAQPVAASWKTDAFRGLQWHTDTDVLNDNKTSELHHLQTMLLLSPPLDGMLRSGVTTALNPATKWQVEQISKAMLGAFSVIESGKVSRAPLERPRPVRVYGNKSGSDKRPTFQEMQKLSQSEIRKSIRDELVPELRKLLPSPRPEDIEAFDQLFSKTVGNFGCLQVREPGTSHKSWMQHAKLHGWRSTVMQLLLRGEEASTLGKRSAFNDYPVKKAVQVLEYSRNVGDPTGIERWCLNAGRKRRKVCHKQNVGDAEARHARAQRKARATRAANVKKTMKTMKAMKAMKKATKAKR